MKMKRIYRSVAGNFVNDFASAFDLIKANIMSLQWTSSGKLPVKLKLQCYSEAEVTVNELAKGSPVNLDDGEKEEVLKILFEDVFYVVHLLRVMFLILYLIPVV